jgi:ATP-dependent DNA helicase PIF1
MELETLKYKMMSDELKTNIKLSKKQNDAYTIMAKGENIFLTGAAGSGKTACIKLFIKVYKSTKIMGITSTTGISALLFGGVTLHSFLGIGLGKESVDVLTNKIQSRSYLKKRWVQLEVLIIDEISMLSPKLFDKLDALARRIRHNPKPFGGIQLILAGDFCQLPCVDSDSFCFESNTWSECVDNTVYLTEIMRQKNIDFQECLNNIRVGLLPKKTRDLLKTRIGVELKNEFGIKPTKLFSTNYSVDYINNNELDYLAQKEPEFYEYDMDITVYPGVKNKNFVIEKYKKSCNAPDTIQICVGAQVMLLWNMDAEKGLVNGSRGVISSFIDDIPMVKFLNGCELLVDHHIWEIEENGEKIMNVSQIPLKVAYALTIHKSQGCSLDYAEIDLSNTFAKGQAYVALSRVKNLDGLSILDIDYNKIVADERAVAFYKNFEI